MFRRFITVLLNLALIITLSGYTDPPPPQNPPALAPDSLLTTAGPDEYGYTLNDGVAYSFLDITSTGDLIDFSDEDNGTTQIGIRPFNYYELASITTAYVNVNGFISFDPVPTRYTQFNKPFPTDFAPNNLIAAFWYDLGLNNLDSTSLIYSQLFSGVDGHTVIQWNNVVAGGYGVITFQIVLYENGDIIFSYKPKIGSFSGVTAGIEDPDGADGLNYSIPDLSSGKTVLITRPLPSVHVKARPQVSSAMLENGAAWYRVRVYNTTDGTLPSYTSDNYNLATTIESSFPTAPPYPWSVTFYDPTCSSIITTLDSLDKGTSRELCIRVSAGGELTPGYYSRLKVTLTSQDNPLRSSKIYLHSAISAPFVQLFQDNADGLNLDLSSSASWLSQNVADPYNGSAMSMNLLWPGHYIISWFESGLIKYRLYNQFQHSFGPTYQIIGSSSVSGHGVDFSPAVTGSRDGKIGFLYIVNSYLFETDHYRVKSNIYFSVLNSSGVIYPGYPKNITNNNFYLDLKLSTPENVPNFQEPRIVKAGTNAFALIWRKTMYDAENTPYDLIQYAIANTDGSDPYNYDEIPGWDDQNRYVYPAEASLKDGRFIIGFCNYTGANNPYRINYFVLNSDGSGIAGSPTVIPDTDATDIDIVQLSDGKVIFAWSNNSTRKSAFAILGNDLNTLVVSPTDLSYEDYAGHPNYRSTGDISVTSDTRHNAILTWEDTDWQEQLYYAVVGSDGTLITPPMLYRKVGSTYPESQLSANGYGNAPLALERYFLPFMRKN